MTEVWIAIVLECWFQKSKGELFRYNYTSDRAGFIDAMGFYDKAAYDSFKLAQS